MYQISNTNPGGSTALPTAQDYRRGLNELNNGFQSNNMPVRFYISCISYIDAPNALDMGVAESTWWGQQHHDIHAVNVHVKDAGQQLFNPTVDAIFINRFTLFDNINVRAFTHEMGHYFRLMHTHQFWNFPCLREPVSRWSLDFSCLPPIRTCATTGDFLCDTPADPNLSRDIDLVDTDGDGDFDLADGNNACRYIGTDIGLLEEFSLPYTPDVTNYMAYANRRCRSTFTEQQQLAMRYNLNKRVFTFEKSHWASDSPEGTIDAYEPDNDVTTASPIAVGEVQGHTLHDFGCEPEVVDWLQLEGEFFGTYTLNITEVQNQPFPVDPDVRVFNADADGVIFDEIPITVNTVANSITVTIPCASVTSDSPRVAIKRNPSSDAGAYIVSLTNVVAQPQFSGAALLDQVCLNGLLELENVPAGATVNWFPMGMGLTNTNNTSAEIEDILPGTSPVRLEVEISSGGCTIVLEKEFQRSIPLIPIETIHKSVETRGDFCPEVIYTYTIDSIPGTVNYSWTCDDCPLQIAADGLSAQLSSDHLPQGTTTNFIVNVTASSDCGESVSQNRADVMTTEHPLDCEPPGIVITPNPGDQAIDISIVHDIENPDYEIYISRQIDAALIHQQNLTEKNLSLNTTEYSNGYYYLHLVYKGIPYTALFLIQH